MTPQARTRRKGAKEAEASAEHGAASDSEAARLDALLAQFGTSGFNVRLERENLNSLRRWDYTGSVPFTHDLFETVLQKLGGGVYRGRVVDSAGDYLHSIAPFSIAGEPLSARPGALVAGSAPASDTRLPWSLAEISTAVVAVSTALAAVVKLFKSDAKPVGDITSTMALVQSARDEGREIGEKIGRLSADHAPSDGGMADAVREIVPAIIDVVRTEQASRRAPARAAAPAVSSSTPSIDTSMPAGYEWLAQLQQYFPALQKQADQGHDDADIVADYAVMRFSDELVGHIAQVVERDDFDATVMAAMPMIARRDWLAAFVARIREQVSTDKMETARASK